MHRLSCSVACGIFLDQGLNSCPLQWQADCYPLYYQEVLIACFYIESLLEHSHTHSCIIYDCSEITEHVCMLSHFTCPTLCDLMGCSPPGCSVHGILQARILECIVLPSSRIFRNQGLNPRLCVSCVCRQVLYHQCHWGSLAGTQVGT